MPIALAVALSSCAFSLWPNSLALPNATLPTASAFSRARFTSSRSVKPRMPSIISSRAMRICDSKELSFSRSAPVSGQAPQ